MNKQTKYYFLIKYTLLSFVFNLVLGFVSRTLQSWDLFNDSIMNPVYDLIGVVKVLLIIATVVGTIYLAFLVFTYYVSKFYRDYKINAFEAVYHGFADIFHVYDRLYDSPKTENIQVDFKRSTIYFNTSEEYYCIKFIDLFGKIEGKLDSEFWASVSRPKTKYNQKVYTKKIKFRNPFRSNQNYIDTLKSKTSKEYQNFLVIAGFYNMKDKDDHILAPYEVLDFIK